MYIPTTTFAHNCKGPSYSSVGVEKWQFIVRYWVCPTGLDTDVIASRGDVYRV